MNEGLGKLTVMGIAVVVFCHFFWAVDAQSQLDHEVLDTYFEQMVDDWQVPSMSVGIVNDGELVYAKGFGVKSYSTDMQPDKNTLYAIASNSKAFTATIMGMLVDDGLLSWDDPVQKYVPYFELSDPYLSHQVTIRDLLCHRVGLGTFSGDVVWYKSNLSSEDIIRRIKYIPLEYKFRAGYGYSNLMYITAGEVIRQVTGKTWAENVKEKILIPLGMDRTITNIDQLDELGNYASPHTLLEGNNVEIPWVDWSEIGAMGGLLSSVEDVCKWMQFNLQHGIWNGDTLLSAQSLNTLWTPHNNYVVDHTHDNPFNRHFNGYGLGWGLSDIHGNLRVGHTGGFDGMLTAVNMIPDKKIGVVVLTNGMKSPMMAATFYALETCLEMEPKDWSQMILNMVNSREENDTRISDRVLARLMDTKPALPLEQYTGTYISDIYGDITTSMDGEGLRLDFEYTPEYACKLTHWHRDVWKINWDTPQAWFQFGTVSFQLDNNLNVLGMEFDVPNDDIFFEELHPKKKNE